MLMIMKRRSPTFKNPQDKVLQVRPLPGTRTWVESAGQAHSVHSLCPCWQGASFVMFLRWKFMHTDKMIVFVCTRIGWLEWKRMATRMIPTLSQVDCTVEQNLCHQMGVSGYPTIRMYPRGSKGFCTFEFDVFFDGIVAGANRYQPYPGNRRDVTSLHAWLQVTKTSILFGKVEILEPQFNVFLPQEQIPSAVENITPFTFKHRF